MHANTHNYAKFYNVTTMVALQSFALIIFHIPSLPSTAFSPQNCWRGNGPPLAAMPEEPAAGPQPLLPPLQSK